MDKGGGGGGGGGGGVELKDKDQRFTQCEYNIFFFFC